MYCRVRRFQRQTPFETVFHRKPSIIVMRVFGSLCYAHIAKAKRSKLDDSGLRCRFLGYAKQSKAYRLPYVTTGEIVISRSVTFVEHAAVLPQNVSDGTPCVIDVVDDEDEECELRNT